MIHEKVFTFLSELYCTTTTIYHGIKYFFFQNQGLRVFLVSGSPKDIGLLYVALTHRVESLRNSLSSPIKNEETEKSVKRKLDEDEDRFSKEESPPPEKEPKIAC